MTKKKQRDIPNMKYKAYTGGAGPSAKQSHRNNLELFNILGKLGFHVRMAWTSPDSFDAANPEDEEAAEAVIVKHGKEEYTVGYDRWGFVAVTRSLYMLAEANLEDVEIDQWPLGNTVGFFLNLRYGETEGGKLKRI